MAGGNEKSGEGGTRDPPYAEYVFDIYREGILEGKMPITTTDPTQLEEQARQHMSTKGFWYVAGGASEGATMVANREAFKKWRILPRMMKPATPRDMRVTLFGDKYGVFPRSYTLCQGEHMRNVANIDNREPPHHGSHRRPVSLP